MYFSWIKIILTCLFYNILIINCDDNLNNRLVNVNDSIFCKSNCACFCEFDNCTVKCEGANTSIKLSYFSDKLNFIKEYNVKKLYVNGEIWMELKEPFAENGLDLLDLSNNSITSIGKGVFQNQLKLNKLILANNFIRKIDVDAFQNGDIENEQNFRNLNTLDLSGNNLTTLEGGIFKNLINLRSLNISRNPLKTLDASTILALQSCVNLKILNLSYTQIDVLPENFLENMFHLINLDLSGNYFTGIPNSLNQSNINKLIMNNNSIHKLELSNGFPVMLNMTTVFLCNMKNLTSIGPKVFGQLINLRELHLCNNPLLNSIDARAFEIANSTGLPPIRKIYLENNRLSNIDENLLDDWIYLDYFNVTGNPWNCSCSLKYLIKQILPVTGKFRDGKQKLIYNDENMRCASPEKLRGKSLYEIVRENVHLRCPGDPDEYSDMNKEQWKPNALGIILGVLFTTLFILILFYFYYRTRRGVLFSNFFVRYSRQADEDSNGY